MSTVKTARTPTNKVMLKLETDTIIRVSELFEDNHKKRKIKNIYKINSSIKLLRENNREEFSLDELTEKEFQELKLEGFLGVAKLNGTDEFVSFNEMESFKIAKIASLEYVSVIIEYN